MFIVATLVLGYTVYAILLTWSQIRVGSWVTVKHLELEEEFKSMELNHWRWWENLPFLKREGTDGKIPKQWIRFALKILET